MVIKITQEIINFNIKIKQLVQFLNPGDIQLVKYITNKVTSPIFNTFHIFERKCETRK